MFKRLLLAIRSSAALRQSAIMTVGTVATALTMAVAMIVAARYLGPEKFSIFSVATSLMGILAVGTHLGLNQLIPRFANRWHDQPKKLNEFIGYMMVLKAGLCIALVVIAGLCVPYISALINFPYPDVIWWSIFGAVGIGLYEHVYLLLSARHNFTGVNIISISQAMLKSVGFMGVLLLTKWGLNGVLEIYFLSPALVALFFGWLWREQVWAEPNPGTAELNQAITQFFGHTFIGIIAMTLISNVDILLVQKYLSPFETGVYAGAGRIALFIGFLTASIGGVLSNRVARYSDKKTLAEYLKKSLSIVGISAVGFLIFLPLAQLSIILTIGPEYISGTGALIVLILNAFLCLAIVPYTAFFYAVDYPAYFSIGGVLQVAIILAGNYFFLQKYGLNAAAWSRTVATLVYCLYTIFCIWYVWERPSEKR